MTTKSKVILGMVGAAALGVVAGILLAPDKGTEVRKKISKAAGDWKGQMADFFSSAKEELANLKNKGTKAASDAASRYTNTTENFS